ncbi:MAG TPA: hypothetical protein DEP17_02195 [Lachnospiraceae bacterium]|nr:hypothetical protein [Lachnospiraceae bacterium]
MILVYPWEVISEKSRINLMIQVWRLFCACGNANQMYSGNSTSTFGCSTVGEASDKKFAVSTWSSFAAA